MSAGPIGFRLIEAAGATESGLMRIVVVGTSGAGKTTLARAIAARLELPHIELDAVNWQSGWRDLSRHDPEEFVRRVSAAIEAEAWVLDGNYGPVRDRVWPRATHLVWLDYQRPVVMARVIRRSLVRVVLRTELWAGTGNRERWQRMLRPSHRSAGHGAPGAGVAAKPRKELGGRNMRGWWCCGCAARGRHGGRSNCWRKPPASDEGSATPRLDGLRQNIEATLLDAFRRGEEIGAEVERCGEAVGFEPHAVLAGDLGEAAGDVRPAGEQHAFDLRADRRQCGAGLVAAIEDGRRAGLGCSLARRFDQCPEPAGAGVDAGFGGARQDDLASGARRCLQRADRMGQRVDDDDDSIGVGVGYGFCSPSRVTRSSSARKRSTTRAFCATIAVICSRILIKVSSWRSTIAVITLMSSRIDAISPRVDAISSRMRRCWTARNSRVMTSDIADYFAAPP
jgi:hypothetical protein